MDLTQASRHPAAAKNLEKAPLVLLHLAGARAAGMPEVKIP